MKKMNLVIIILLAGILPLTDYIFSLDKFSKQDYTDKFSSRHIAKLQTITMDQTNPINYYGTVGLDHHASFVKNDYIATDIRKDANCLAQMIYFEARGDIFDEVKVDDENSEYIVTSYESFLAHANVVMERINNDEFPDTVCSVIHQSGQFSPNLKLKKYNFEPSIYNQLYKMSVDFLISGYRLDNTDSALFFKAKSKKNKKKISYNEVFYIVKTNSIMNQDFFKLEEKQKD